MPTTTYVLELTDAELAIIWGLLVVMDIQWQPDANNTGQEKADMAFKSALSKIQRLMEGK